MERVLLRWWMRSLARWFPDTALGRRWIRLPDEGTQEGHRVCPRHEVEMRLRERRCPSCQLEMPPLDDPAPAPERRGNGPRPSTLPVPPPVASPLPPLPMPVVGCPPGPTPVGSSAVLIWRTQTFEVGSDPPLLVEGVVVRSGEEVRLTLQDEG